MDPTASRKSDFLSLRKPPLSVVWGGPAVWFHVTNTGFGLHHRYLMLYIPWQLIRAIKALSSVDREYRPDAEEYELHDQRLIEYCEEIVDKREAWRKWV